MAAGLIESLLGTRTLVVAAAALTMVHLCFAAGCQEEVSNATSSRVTLGSRTFTLELALDEQTRFRGLSGRTVIAEDGGMLFVFSDSSTRSFVMRDCPIPIDIIYLDGTGRITAMHEMKPEAPRDPIKEPAPKNPFSEPDPYERRLKLYSSKFGAQYVIELRGGTIPTLGLKEGQKIEIDPNLKKRAK
jgi:uncharacterized membrane protein (UPF0127 family)